MLFILVCEAITKIQLIINISIYILQLFVKQVSGPASQTKNKESALWTVTKRQSYNFYIQLIGVQWLGQANEEVILLFDYYQQNNISHKIISTKTVFYNFNIKLFCENRLIFLFVPSKNVLEYNFKKK